MRKSGLYVGLPLFLLALLSGVPLVIWYQMTHISPVQPMPLNDADCAALVGLLPMPFQKSSPKVIHVVLDYDKQGSRLYMQMEYDGNDLKEILSRIKTSHSNKRKDDLRYLLPEGVAPQVPWWQPLKEIDESIVLDDRPEASIVAFVRRGTKSIDLYREIPVAAFLPALLTKLRRKPLNTGFPPSQSEFDVSVYDRGNSMTAATGSDEHK